LLLSHHEPSRTDAAIDDIVATYSRSRVQVQGASEDMVIDLPR
jgi:hypothetical protein